MSDMSDTIAASFAGALEMYGETVTIAGTEYTALVTSGEFQAENIPGLVVYNMQLMIKIADYPTPEPDAEVVLTNRDNEQFFIQPRQTWRRRPAWWILPLYKDEFV